MKNPITRNFAALLVLCAVFSECFANELITLNEQSERILVYNYSEGQRTFSSGSFQFTFALLVPPVGHGAPPFAWLSTGGICGGGCVSTGSMVYYSFNSSQLTMTANDGGLFTLGAFDAAQTAPIVVDHEFGMAIEVKGTYEDGTTTSAFIISPEGQAYEFRTFTMPTSFANVKSVNFIASGYLLPHPLDSFAIDNIRVGALPVQDVPAPSTISLVFGGFAGFLALTRRQRKNSEGGN